MKTIAISNEIGIKKRTVQNCTDGMCCLWIGKLLDESRISAAKGSQVEAASIELDGGYNLATP